MSNIFLETGHDDIETAILYEDVKIIDIDNSIAYTDGNRVFMNTEDNLAKLLPNYNKDMLKWLLWHEKYHMELRHHDRFYKYLSELKREEKYSKLSKEEVNIIMDILVHDSLSKLFPELVETARSNLAQMRDSNSLKYTFKTFNLEDMLKEYEDQKKDDGTGDSKEGKEKVKTGEEDEKDKSSSHDKDKAKSKEDESESKDEKTESGRHDEVDWSKLEDIDSKEFIERYEGDYLEQKIEDLKRKKIKLGRLTQTLNGLATTVKTRTYSMPSYIPTSDSIILKGKLPGRTALYLCFDASGSMGEELEMFKEIITKSIPHAMEVPCEWFTYQYGKGKFKDIMGVYADNGFNDDGDRVIELCLKAEQKGYSPIGITDGGGGIYRPENLKKLKRTILIGQCKSWLKKAKEINPNIQILDIS